MKQEFTVPGQPSSQGRPKFSRAANFVRVYDPAKSRSWKAYCAQMAITAKIKVHEGPVKMTIDAVYSRPTSGIPKWKGTDRMPRGSRPDWDNIGKIVSDALNGIAYQDDSAIVCGVVNKWVAAEGEMPHVKVTLEDVEVPKNPKESK